MLRTLFSFRDRYRILHLTWFAFFLSFVVWFDVAPFATTIQCELHLTSPQLKVLAICSLALTVPTRIVIGMVLDRYGARLTFSALLLFAVVLCWLTATAQDFNQLVWSSLINSILGAGFVVGVRMVAEWFSSNEIGLVQGIYGGWGNFGAAADQFCLPVLAVTMQTAEQLTEASECMGQLKALRVETITPTDDLEQVGDKYQQSLSTFSTIDC